MLSPHVEQATVITDDENYFLNMAYLTDYPREFKWYSEHELLPDGGWKVVRRRKCLPPQAPQRTSTTPFDNHLRVILFLYF